MKVILLENIRKIGSIGEIINVKRGFARNYLISHKKALFASKKNIGKKDLERKRLAKEISDKIQNKTYDIRKLSTENKELYGSVKPTEISSLIMTEENLEINSSLIQPVKDIKSLGKFKVQINLHSEVQFYIFIKVIPEEEKS